MGMSKTISDAVAPIAAAAPRAAYGLRQLLELAIDGVGPLQGAKLAAAKAFGRKRDAEKAIDQLITIHVGLAGAQGFLTNVGGLATLLIAVPSNVAGLAIVQGRMLAGIAHLRGYDIDDPRVRTALIMCLLGEDMERHIRDHKLPSSPMAIATAPVFDPELDTKVSTLVLTALLSQSGGTKLSVLASKRIPILGGGVGAMVDGWSTRHIGQHAKRELRTRRAIRA